jgi:hypothetical protein
MNKLVISLNSSYKYNYDNKVKKKLYLGRFYEEWIKMLLFESTDLFYVL